MASPTQNHSPAYDVFLNHRGLDTKKGFAGHLYHRIRSQGIRVFLDKYELPVGNELTHEITAAIKTASVHVAIFSKNYAESDWCLKELVLMLESRDSGATVIPIFYGVKPSSLRWTQGEDRQRLFLVSWMLTIPSFFFRLLSFFRQTEPTYAEQLQKLKNKRVKNGERLFDEKTIAKWEKALKTAAYLKGLELEACNGYEGELVEKIVKLVSEKVIKTPYNVPKYENIGLDVKLKGVEDKVSSKQQQNGKPRVVGIEGSGGVGKTTLAKEFFHTESPAYRNSCFFPVRQIARRTPLDSLFGELFKSLSCPDLLLNNVDAVKKLNNPSLDGVKNNPSLVILDGVEKYEQAKNLLSIQEVLHSGSLILITSRHRDVLKRSGVKDALIYKLNGLEAPWSRKLFCLHAFHQAAPSQGYEYLVGGFEGLCNGLPLLLEVFGAFLYGKNDRSYWEELLDGFQDQQIQPHEIEKKLKLIYDRLNIKERHVFLDIAHFFMGKSTDTALATRKGSGWKGSLWLQTLVEKRLVEVYRDYYKPMEVDRNYCIEMHHQLEDLGRSIAQEPREPRPLWPNTDSNDDLLQQSLGITELRRNIDALSQQSSEQVKELRGFMQNILTMMSRNMPEKR